ncbi:TPR-like protein [Saccharata proteae CBS 121410]|uniref:TPR-like protein n=1 Tax=Saccharata proteae CBS 121410 TaxID=1314787 RepID=A0A9P4LUZ3_9PEZI|nr:TPR-like protein [Saccharata proteae CBS 121410]
MSPTATPYVATQLRGLIYYHLDNDLIQNALFLAGRLHGLEPRSADAAHLLALCNFRMGRLKAAYEYSRDKAMKGQHLGCAYVFAQACLGLGRAGDGISALDKSRGLWGGRNHWNKHSETSRRHLPDAAAVNCLLGKLWRAHNDVTKAIGCYVEALKLNPFMWDAFTELCDTGAAIRPSNVFKITPEMSAYLAASSMLGPDSPPANEDAPPQSTAGPNGIFTPGADPFNSTMRQNGEGGSKFGVPNLFSRAGISLPKSNATRGLDAETPVANGGLHDDDVMMGEGGGKPLSRVPSAEPPQAPVRRSRQPPSLTDSAIDVPRMKSITTRSRGKSGSETDAPEPTKPAVNGAQKRSISGHTSQANINASTDPSSQPRRSHRLMQSVQDQFRPSGSRTTTISSREAEAKEREKREAKRAKLPTAAKGRSAAAGGVGRVISGNRKPVQEQAAVVTESAKEREALQWLLDLFAKIGNGHFQLSRFRCQNAVQAFSEIPLSSRETPWVLAQIGKAHYERGAYAEAEEVFAKIKKMAPSRMEDMEVYSTVLWHLKNEIELAYLAHELMEADRLSPQAWCAIGNSFSLQREHDQAIKCFKRATQLDPTFAYAFTLQGHEHVANEEYDKAQQAYRCAVSADPRHYNGWYGLGRVYEKMGKYEMAEKHYKAAAHINPTNAVLIVCIGVVLEKTRKPQLALAQYTIACELDPRSALARFKKARALMNVRNAKEALAELEILKDIAPDEANVHFMLGRLYKMMHDKTAAIRHFTIALNLDPKAAQYIKEAMESLEDDDEDDWDDDDDDAT